MQTPELWTATIETTRNVAEARQLISTRSVLVVEDEVALLRALGRLLRRDGYLVATAASYAQAQRTSVAFDLALLDIELGDGSGVVLARELLASGRAGRVLFHTGCTSQSTLASAAELGPVLSKPSSFEVLLAAIRSSADREVLG
ncbi:MAG: response regulator [Polyangiaceae bacterium]|nr:response regulator [Polyangiaceae bacterium]